MHLVAVYCPKYEDSFDGRIRLERVQRVKVLSHASKNHVFMVNVYINETVKRTSGGR